MRIFSRNGSKNGYRKRARYSALSLFRHGLTGSDWQRAWHTHDLKNAYDVVIIGGGVHGLATAYYLAKEHGISDVAVLEKGYIGGGGSGRNTAIIRSNYLTPEGVRFYDRSVKLYEHLSAELNFNVMFAQRGHLTLAHSDSSLRTMSWRAEVNKLEGVDSGVIGPEEVKRLVPFMDTSKKARYPILGALYHPPGGIIRHDAVVWGYARAADARGVHIHQNTEVTGIDVENGRVRGVKTKRGDVKTNTVINCTAGWSTLISEMAGVKLPISTFPLQAAVTEPVRPFLDPVIVSGTLHVYVSQTDRGELVFGASVDPFTSYSMRGSLEFIEAVCGRAGGTGGFAGGDPKAAGQRSPCALLRQDRRHRGLLGGRHFEGSPRRQEGGLRLHRAGQALHHGDHGSCPGQARDCKRRGDHGGGYW